jgi:two-component system, sensor histidine kinase and response regulator
MNEDIIESVTILVVDDNEENLKVVSNLLREKGYRIALATDGKSAIKILATNKIDLILLDIMMPEMDGFEVCKILKEKPETKDIPIIFLTARSETEDIVKGFQIGGVDYVTKPFKKEELHARVTCQIQLKLVKDYLIKCEIDVRKSRDYYMRTLYELGKILSHEK